MTEVMKIMNDMDAHITNISNNLSKLEGWIADGTLQKMNFVEVSARLHRQECFGEALSELINSLIDKCGSEDEFDELEELMIKNYDNRSRTLSIQRAYTMSMIDKEEKGGE